MGTPAFDADEMGMAIPEKVREKFKTNHVKDFDKKDMGLFPVRWVVGGWWAACLQGGNGH